MRLTILLAVFALAACQEPKASFPAPTDAAEVQRIIRASYETAITRQSGALAADDARTQQAIKNGTRQDVNIPVRQIAMRAFTHGDPARPLRQRAKLEVEKVGMCTWQRMGGEQHTADLFAISATHGYRCFITVKVDELEMRTCKYKKVSRPEQAYIFADAAGLHYAPTPETWSPPFGEDPWDACKNGPRGPRYNQKFR